MKFRTRYKQKRRKELERLKGPIIKELQNDYKKYHHNPQSRTGLWVKVFLKSNPWFLR